MYKIEGPYAELYSVSKDVRGNMELQFTNAETVHFTPDTLKLLRKMLNSPARGRSHGFCPHCGEVLNG